jgi:peptide/nickel transport system ATP-binding protein
LSLLTVKNLTTVYQTSAGPLRAVDGLDFSLERGRTIGIVGESGCGKSAAALSIMRLIQPPGRIAEGKILFEGRDLLGLNDQEMRALRGSHLSMIFQEPMTSLNPVYTCGNQVEEVVRLHFPKLSRKESRARALEMFREVGIPAPERRFDEYPHQLSGGTRQRVMIAMAMVCRPKLLIADEPTTALDVTIQAQILDLIRSLQASESMGLILITHDLGVVAEMCHEVVIMYAGYAVERGTAIHIFENPKHPYTRGLLDSVPRMNAGGKKERLKAIPGSVPSLLELPKGCRFADRCPRARALCREQDPPLTPDPKDPAHSYACHFPLENPA